MSPSIAADDYAGIAAALTPLSTRGAGSARRFVIREEIMRAMAKGVQTIARVLNSDVESRGYTFSEQWSFDSDRWGAEEIDRVLGPSTEGEKFYRLNYGSEIIDVIIEGLLALDRARGADSMRLDLTRALGQHIDKVEGRYRADPDITGQHPRDVIKALLRFWMGVSDDFAGIAAAQIELTLRQRGFFSQSREEAAAPRRDDPLALPQPAHEPE